MVLPFMESESMATPSQPVILGFDPGRLKCGLAIMGIDRTIFYHKVIEAETVLATVQELCLAYPVSLIVIGNQTSSKEWKRQLSELPESRTIVLVDERNSTLEARDRYWQMYPPNGLRKLVPQALRRIPQPIDDIVAILLIERYLERLVT